MKKIFTILLFIFLLVSCSTPKIKTTSLSPEEEKSYYRSLVENPPADIENYKFSDYDIEMILEVKEEIRKEQLIKELKAKREQYLSKETTNSNNKKQRTLSEEEIKLFEKMRQYNQQRLEQLDKEIMLLEESN